MGHPYHEFVRGERIRAEDWNEVQKTIKRELRTHRHGGASHDETDATKLGGLLTSASLQDEAVTMEKLMEDSVSSRALARESVQPRHFQDNANIAESKVAFDPDEPISYASVDVELTIPEDILATGSILWSIPAGTPITDDLGELVFRTIESHVVSDENPSIVVAVRAERPGTRYNLPSGSLTRVGGALDPYLRAHVTVTQMEPSQGGVDGSQEQPPLAAQAPLSFQVSARAPRSFWVVPKGSVVTFVPQQGGDPVAYATRESLPVFPCTTWVEAEAELVGEAGNVPAGTLSILDEATHGPSISVAQVQPATGGTAADKARVWVRLRLLVDPPENDIVLPANLLLTDGVSAAFRTLTPVTLHAGGTDYVMADPLLTDDVPPVPAGPLDIDPTCRPRAEKTYDPSLLRHLSAQKDPGFTPGPEQPHAIRLAWTFSKQAPMSAWTLLRGTQFVSSGRNASGGGTATLPTFEALDDHALLPRSYVVLAHAEQPGNAPLPAGSLDQIVAGPDPALLPIVEVEQLTASQWETNGIEHTLVRFRVFEGTALPAGEDHWTIPYNTELSDGNRSFFTREPAAITLGASGRFEVQAMEPGSHGNVAAGTLDLVHPDSSARIGSAIDDTLSPYIAISQPEDAHGGGEPLQRATAVLRVTISANAPRFAWRVPADTRLARTPEDEPVFATLEQLTILPRRAWIWAQAEVPGTSAPAGLLNRVLNPPSGLIDQLVIEQIEPSANDQVRVWFRIVDRAPFSASRSWTIPSGTRISDANQTVVYATTADLTLDSGGTGIMVSEANIAGQAGNNIFDITGLANPEDFERFLEVLQELGAKGGADGGSDGHHHGNAPDALPSRSLAPASVGKSQVADSSIAWDKLSPSLVARIQAMRTQLENVEQALSSSGMLAALALQRHQST